MTDIASIRLDNSTKAEEFLRFVGALAAARRLQLDVTLRVVNDPVIEGKYGQKVPLDIYAECAG